MVFVKYFWGFDNSVEGWENIDCEEFKWEEGGQGGFPTGHLYMKVFNGQSSSGWKGIKSPRDLNLSKGDIICFLFSYHRDHDYNDVSKVKVEIVDADENVIFTKELSLTNSKLDDTVFSAVFVIDDDIPNACGFNVLFYTYTAYGNRNHVRIDSVTVYENPDQVIHTPIPSTLQSTVTHEIPVNKSGSYVVGALRLDDVQGLVTYDEKLIYDGSNEYDYDKGVTPVVTTSSSIDKVTITHNASNDLQLFYECDHVVWLLNPDTYYPQWLVLIKCYHNHNLTDPDTVSFSAVLDGTNPYTETKTMSLKFNANGLFNLKLTPLREVVSGDLSQLTQLDAVITVKDSNGNTIGTCNYDVLNDSYDNPINVDKSYDGQDLTIEITVTANGTPSATVSINLKLNFEFSY